MANVHDIGEGSRSLNRGKQPADGAAPEAMIQSTVVQVQPNIPTPAVGMLFDSLGHLMKYYHEYGRSRGFQVRIRTVGHHGRGQREQREDPRGEWDENANRARLVCAKAGDFKSKSKNPKYNAKSMKTGCGAKLNAWRTGEGHWRVSKVVNDHNHEMNLEEVRFMANFRGIGVRDKGRLVINNRAGIPMNKNYQSIVMDAGGYGNANFSERDARNLIDKQRRLILREGDYAAMEEVFERMARHDKEFTHAKETNEEGRLRNVFWVDGRSRSAFKDFGDVVSFDATYLKNRYRMPFTPFIGVNHHGQSILFGCALISAEDTSNYKWLFRKWKEAMRGVEPKGIITDQCAAMGKAIAEVFPNTRHRWCLWHIMKNFNKHLHAHERWEELLTSLQAVIYNAITEREFENAWGEFVEEFDLVSDHWVQEKFETRRMWAPVFFKDSFWAGMSTTQRSEGMNNFFKSFVNLNSTLLEFAEQFNLALAKRVEEEAEQSFISKNSPLQRCSQYPFEVVFQEKYTNKKLEEFQEQIKGAQYCVEKEIRKTADSIVYNVEDNTRECLWFRPEGLNVKVHLTRSPTRFKCECKNFEFRGIICRHIVRILLVEKIDYVPMTYVLDRWRKDLSRNYLTFPVTHYSSNTRQPEPAPFMLMREKFDEVAHQLMGNPEIVNEFLRKLDELKEKSVTVAESSTRIITEHLSGDGWVYRRRRRPAICPDDDGENEGLENITADLNSSPVIDPVDRRKRGRIPGHRAGYNNEKKGKKKQKVSPAAGDNSGPSTVDLGGGMVFRPPYYGNTATSPLLSPAFTVIQGLTTPQVPRTTNLQRGDTNPNNNYNYIN